MGWDSERHLTCVRALAGNSLRVRDALQQLHPDASGLPLMLRFPNAASFHIADNFQDRSKTLALFNRGGDMDIGRPLRHSLQSIISRLQSLSRTACGRRDKHAREN